MIPIARLKQNLDFNKNLGELIEVMKLAATLRFNQFRLTRQSSEKFSQSFEEIVKYIPAEKDTRNIYLRSRPSDPAIIVLISTDEGFLGELNALLINKLVELRRQEDTVIVLGQQGANYLGELNIDFKSFPSIHDKIELKQIEALRDYVVQLYSKGKSSRVHVVYSSFVNITSQQIESEIVLPLSETYFSRDMEATAALLKKRRQDYLIEPDLDSVVEGWIKLWLGFRFFQIFWSSKLAEFAARVMHLEGSIRELTRVNQHLRLEYFKYLHGLSDKTIREIFASRLKTNKRDMFNF